MSTPTFKMTGNDNLDTLLTKINHGADVNITGTYGDTALMIASTYGYIDIVKLLLEKGADVNITGKYGHSALMRASYNGYTTICKLLIENGANLNIQSNDGGTSLIWASIKKNIDICKLLLENGADLYIQNNNENTAIDIMENREIYRQVNPYKILGLKYFKEIFQEHAEAYVDIFETTLYSQDLEIDDIMANIDMFYITIISKMADNTINENVEL